MVGDFRTALGAFFSRARFAAALGKTFRGKRDLYKALGYKESLLPEDFRARFIRNAVANRVVKALPSSTWRGGAEIIEDEDPTKDTPFETAFIELDRRLKIWSTFSKADVLAGLGHYAVIYMVAPGESDQPLGKCKPEDLRQLRCYAEEDAKISELDIDPKSPRFGLPVYYLLARTSSLIPSALGAQLSNRRVHFSRCIHVADGLLDDSIYGEPRLEAIWNDLDDLEKVKGGGAEAFWRRADGGTQFDLDPDVEFEDEDATQGQSTADATKTAAKASGMKKQIEEMEHGLRRNLLTRGVTIHRMGSDVADFAGPVASIISVISAGTGIPQRVLMGSEQGKLAAKMDRSNWDDRVADRRSDYAGPLMVRPFVDKLIEIGALPEPKEYDVRWPQIKVMDDEMRASVAQQWAALNQSAGERIVTPDEIRERILNLPPLDEATDFTSLPLPGVDTQAAKDRVIPGVGPKTPKAARFARKLACLPLDRQVAVLRAMRAVTGKEAQAWQHVHRAADYFRQADEVGHDRFLRGWPLGIAHIGLAGPGDGDDLG